jgi:hypothetical protein
MIPALDRADAIGSYWANPKTRSFGELLIDCEEDRTLRSPAARREDGHVPQSQVSPDGLDALGGLR